MNEDILQSFKSESALSKVIVSQKKESNSWNESVLKRIPSRFMLLLRTLIAPHTWENLIFALVWMKKQIHSLPLYAAFGALKAHKHCFEWNCTNYHRLASHKGGVWKNESLSESFTIRWANKVKIHAYYKKMKVFFDLASISTCCWGLPKPKYVLIRNIIRNIS